MWHCSLMVGIARPTGSHKIGLCNDRKPHHTDSATGFHLSAVNPSIQRATLDPVRLQGLSLISAEVDLI